MPSIKSLQPLFLALGFTCIAFAPAGLALDAAAGPAALDILTTRAQDYARLRLAYGYLGRRTALINQFRREADELAASDFAQAAPRYAAVLAVLQAAFASEELGGHPADDDEQAFADRWNQVTTSAGVWALVTAADQKAYRLDDLRTAYENGKIARLIQDYENRAIRLATQKAEAAGVFRTRFNAAEEAFKKERREIEAAQAGFASSDGYLVRTGEKLDKRSREIDDLCADYKHDGEQLHRDVERFNRNHGTREEGEKLHNRQLNLDEYYSNIQEKIARLNYDVQERNAQRQSLVRLGAEIKRRVEVEDAALTAFRHAQAVAGPLD